MVCIGAAAAQAAARAAARAAKPVAAHAVARAVTQVVSPVSTAARLREGNRSAPYVTASAFAAQQTANPARARSSLLELDLPRTVKFGGDLTSNRGKFC